MGRTMLTRNWTVISVTSASLITSAKETRSEDEGKDLSKSFIIKQPANNNQLLLQMMLMNQNIKNLLGVVNSKKQQDPELQALKEEVATLKTELGMIVQSSKPLVFTGELGYTQTLGAGSTLVFRRVLVNEGDMYDPRTGVVNIPQNGVYLIHLRADPTGGVNNGVKLDLLVNNVHQIYSYGERGAVGGVSVALPLKAYDRIHVVKFDSRTTEGAAIFSVVRVSP